MEKKNEWSECIFLFQNEWKILRETIDDCHAMCQLYTQQKVKKCEV